jgi:2-keto-3-deoxy-6-phosphogluconate aldolase
MASLENRIARLEQRASRASQHRFCGVMTPGEWEAAAKRGYILEEGEQLSGGVFIIPAVMTPEEWEKAAIEHHAKLVKVSMLG